MTQKANSAQHATVDGARRAFLTSTATALAAAAVPRLANGSFVDEKKANKICAFIKFLQSLSYAELADAIAKLGFDGIEATVRDRGHVLPERVEEDLPKLVEALKARNLEVTIMASSVNRADQPHTEKVLKTAAALGIRRYRMAYYRYDLKRPVSEQLKQLAPVVKDLVQMNREIGMTAVYQNHSGANFVGAPIWDLRQLFRDYPVRDIGVAFDIRHATVEGGQAWPLHFNFIRPHLGAVYAKDFRWIEGEKRPRNAPLGTGRVDRSFFETLKQSNFAGPISLHVEYLPQGSVPENLAALDRDLQVLKRLLGRKA